MPEEVKLYYLQDTDRFGSSPETTLGGSFDVSNGVISMPNLVLDSNNTLIQLGNGDEVFKADTQGIYLGDKDFDDAPFSVNMDGDLTANSVTTILPSDNGNLGSSTYRWSSVYSKLLDLKTEGTVKVNTDMITLSNTGAATDMVGTTQGLLFQNARIGSAVLVDGSVGAGSERTSTTVTISTTVSDNTNRMLVAVAHLDTAFGSAYTGCTYGGVDMTLHSAYSSTANNDTGTYIYYILNPTVGTADVVATGDDSKWKSVAVYSLYNVNQSDPFDAIDNYSSSGSIASGGTEDFDSTTSAGNALVLVNIAGKVTSPYLSYSCSFTDGGNTLFNDVTEDSQRSVNPNPAGSSMFAGTLPTTDSGVYTATIGNEGNRSAYYHALLIAVKEDAGGDAAVAESARITVGTETNWTTDTGTHDAYMTFQTGAAGTVSEAMRIASSGRVGVANTTPENELDVGGTSQAEVLLGAQTGEATENIDLVKVRNRSRSASMVDTSGSILFEQAGQGSTITPDTANTTTGTHSGSGKMTLSHTVAPGDNRCLVVCAGTRYNSGLDNPAFDSEDMTVAESLTRAGGGGAGGGTSIIWYLVNPPVGTYDFTANGYDSNCTASVSLTTLYNVDVADPINSTDEVLDLNGGTQTNTITTDEDNCLIVDCSVLGDWNGSPASATLGAGQTQLFTSANGGGSQYHRVQGSYKYTTTLGAYDTSWTSANDGSVDSQMLVQVAFNEDIGIPPVNDAGRITVGAETNWTQGDGSTQDSYMTFNVSDEGTLTEALKLTSSQNTLIPASAYLNWSTTEGTSGYGFRDNSGVLEYKDSGGVWTPMGVPDGQGYMEVVSKNSTYTAADEIVIMCDASGGAFSINLPPVSGLSGRYYHIKKVDSSSNAVTIDADGTETIDGELTQPLITQYNSAQVICSGTSWHIL